MILDFYFGVFKCLRDGFGIKVNVVNTRFSTAIGFEKQRRRVALHGTCVFGDFPFLLKPRLLGRKPEVIFNRRTGIGGIAIVLEKVLFDDRLFPGARL